MKISKDQLDILNSFSVTRLKDDYSLFRDVNAFENLENENLVDYLVGDAFEDDTENRCACYVVRDGDGEILCYFSIKCGLVNHYKNMMRRSISGGVSERRCDPDRESLPDCSGDLTARLHNLKTMLNVQLISGKHSPLMINCPKPAGNRPHRAAG